MVRYKTLKFARKFSRAWPETSGRQRVQIATMPQSDQSAEGVLVDTKRHGWHCIALPLCERLHTGSPRRIRAKGTQNEHTDEKPIGWPPGFGSAVAPDGRGTRIDPHRRMLAIVIFHRIRRAIISARVLGCNQRFSMRLSRILSLLEWRGRTVPGKRALCLD